MVELNNTKANERKSSDKMEKFKRLAISLLYEYFSFFLILVALVILTIGFFYIIKPKKDQITRNLETANVEKIAQKGDLESLLKKIKGYEIQYGKIDDVSKQRIDLLLPKKPETESLFVQIEDLVVRRGLVLTDLMIGDMADDAKSAANQARGETKQAATEEIPAKIGVIKIALKIKGVDYSALKGFLTAIEANLRVTDVRHINFSPKDNSLTLEMNTYYLKS